MNNKSSNLQNIRIDKWLWAARFFKTRQLAVKAIKSGKITINKQRAKPASNIKEGDEVSIRRGAFEKTIIIQTLSSHRGPATLAQTLYKETEQSINKALELKQQLASQPHNELTGRKPDKHTRRINRQLKRQQ